MLLRTSIWAVFGLAQMVLSAGALPGTFTGTPAALVPETITAASVAPGIESTPPVQQGTNPAAPNLDSKRMLLEGIGKADDDPQAASPAPILVPDLAPVDPAITTRLPLRLIVLAMWIGLGVMGAAGALLFARVR